MTSRGSASLPQMTVGRMPSSTSARYLWLGAAPFRLVSGCPTGSRRTPRVGQRRWPSSQRLRTEGDRPSPPSSEPRPQPGRHSRPAARSVAWGQPETWGKAVKAAQVRKPDRQGRGRIVRLDHQPAHQPVVTGCGHKAGLPLDGTLGGNATAGGGAVPRCDAPQQCRTHGRSQARGRCLRVRGGGRRPAAWRCHGGGDAETPLPTRRRGTQHRRGGTADRAPAHGGASPSGGGRAAHPERPPGGWRARARRVRARRGGPAGVGLGLRLGHHQPGRPVPSGGAMGAGRPPAKALAAPPMTVTVGARGCRPLTFSSLGTGAGTRTRNLLFTRRLRSV